MWRTHAYQGTCRLRALTLANLCQSQAGTAGAPSAEVQEMIDDDEPLIVAQNLVSFVERLDDELYLSLRLLDNHSSEFLKRLQDIAPLLSLAQEVQDYYENLGNNNVAARLAMRRLEHLYYKHDDLIVRAATKCPQVGDQPEGRQEFINKLAMKVYRYGDAALHPRAMLCQVLCAPRERDWKRGGGGGGRDGRGNRREVGARVTWMRYHYQVFTWFVQITRN